MGKLIASDGFVRNWARNETTNEPELLHVFNMPKAEPVQAPPTVESVIAVVVEYLKSAENKDGIYKQILYPSESKIRIYAPGVDMKIDEALYNEIIDAIEKLKIEKENEQLV